MEEWKEYKLGDVLQDRGYIRGPFGSSLKRSDLLDIGVPVYEQQHAIYNSRTFRYYINDEKFKSMERFSTFPDDLIVSCSGTVGKVSIIKKEDPKGIISQALLLLRVNKGIVLPDYLLYFFKSNKGYNSIVSRSEGSVQVNISKRDVIEQIPLYLPSLSKQKLIVSILSSLDSKIETNRKINENLEQQAQALFKSWFIDFEPFKDGEFVESEMGMIPKGWKVEKLGNCCKILLGGTPSRKKKNYWGGDIAWINSGEVNKFRIVEPSEYITKTGLDNSATKLLPKKTTVLAITGATLGQVSLLEIDSCANQSVVGILENDTIRYEFIYPLIKNKIKELVRLQTGGAQQHINKGNVECILIALPTSNILKKYSKVVRTMYDQIGILEKENHTNSQLRDTLLPKLMSGEIKINP